MLNQLKKSLLKAEGRSEFVIAVICDIRGFSNFSTCHESPDTAMFIKRFYLKLIQEYFKDAIFAKPTGDGLLLIFRYTEENLKTVSKYVLNACIKTMNDFPKMFKDDAMINFETPQELGFGISRGPACCLFAGRTIIDYSGRLLNLAARLNDLARPHGIVIDGNYLKEVIPENLATRFESREVYIRGIAEDKPITILYLSPEVILPSQSLYPISNEAWESFEKSLTVTELKKLSGRFGLKLPNEPVSPDKLKLELGWRNKKLEGYTTWREYKAYEISRDSTGFHLLINLDDAKKLVKDERLKSSDTITLNVQFVPKKGPLKKGRKKLSP